MKLVRCNKCNHEYYICEFTDKLGIAQDIEMCDYCHARDYTVLIDSTLEDNIRFEYSTYAKANDLATQQEDLRHSLSLFKEELSELVKTYIEPFLK